MKHFTISVIHSGLAGYVGTVTDPTGEELHRTTMYVTPHGAFNVAARWVEKQGWFDTWLHNE